MNTKERRMSPKGWLHKANGKVSALAFLQTHRSWLETGEVSQFTSPIIAKLDSGELLPTPTLELIKSVVLGHILASDALKAEKSIEKASEPRVRKDYLATIRNSRGDICFRINDKGEEVLLQETFDKSSDADRWVDRRLFDGESDWYGIVQHTKMVDRHGHALATVILRMDAMARILKAPKGPVMKGTPKSAGRLSFGVKVKEDRARFSAG